MLNESVLIVDARTTLYGFGDEIVLHYFIIILRGKFLRYKTQSYFALTFQLVFYIHYERIIFIIAYIYKY